MSPEIIPDEFWLGVEQFNQRSFYLCHDILEALWMQANQPQKAFYQGLLQIAVAFYHLENANWQGTVTLLGAGIYRLGPYQPVYSGVDVKALVHQSLIILSELQHQGIDHIHHLKNQIKRSPDTSGDRSSDINAHSKLFAFPVIIRVPQPPADSVH